MQILSGPWADVALLLRQTLTGTDGFLPAWLFGLLLFLPVCLLLLQLITYFGWKLRQGRSVIKFSCPLHIQSSHRALHLVWCSCGCINTGGG